MSFTITTATATDAALLAHIGAETFIDTYGVHNKPEDMEAYVESSLSLPKIKEELENAANTFFIIKSEDMTIGYAKMSKSPKPTKLDATNSIEINRFYIIKTWQHKKAGTALMQYCMDKAKLENYTTVWVDVWQLNPGAIAFYKKWGFKIFDTKIFVLGDDRQDDFLMKKDL